MADLEGEAGAEAGAGAAGGWERGGCWGGASGGRTSEPAAASHRMSMPLWPLRDMVAAARRGGTADGGRGVAGGQAVGPTCRRYWRPGPRMPGWQRGWLVCQDLIIGGAELVQTKGP